MSWPRQGVAAACAVVVLAFAAAPAGASMSYYGGPIMPTANTVLVDWGSSVSSTFTSGDPGFLTSLGNQAGSTTGVTGVLAQYLDSTASNYTGGSYDAQYTITPSVSGTTIQDSDIQSELVSQINAGNLPSPAGDGTTTLYVVLFPHGDTICDGGASQCSTNSFCAYHGDTSLNASTSVLYAVMPDESTQSGCGSSTAFNNQTVILSHEWAEAINDPLVAETNSLAYPLAWYDQVDGEIGDICNQIATTNGSYRVQKLWSNLDSACVGGESKYGAPGAAFTAPTGVDPGQSASFSGSSSTDPSGNHASVTWGSPSQTKSIPSGIASYTWSWGDGSADSTGVNASHTYTAQGIYNVTLTVKDNLGFVGAVTHQVGIGEAVPTPPPSSTTPPPSGSTTAAAPQASTSPATGIGPFAATLQGTVDPRGGATTYHFEYGTTTAYGTSTPAASAGSASGAVPVSYAISALAPATTYHYRVVASSAGGTSTSGDQTFTTSAAPPPAANPAAAPKLSSLKLTKRSIARLLAHGLRVRFHCDKACTARFTLTFQLPAGLGRRATALVLARGTAKLAHAGTRTVVLRFNRSGKKALGHKSKAKLVLTAIATAGGQQSKPVVVKLTVKR